MPRSKGSGGGRNHQHLGRAEGDDVGDALGSGSARRRVGAVGVDAEGVDRVLQALGVEAAARG